MQAGEELEMLGIESAVVQRVRKPRQQRPPHLLVNHWECVGMPGNQLDQGMHFRDKFATQS